MRTRLRRVVGSVMVATLVVAGIVPTGHAQAEPEVATVGIRESLDYLMTTYGVSEAEALRRLRLQARAADMTDMVKRSIGDELLWVWLDQANGGRLTFLTSRPEQAQAALGPDFDPGQVRLVRSRHTSAELRAAETAVRARLSGLADVQIGVDTADESVRVRYGGTDASRAATVRRQAGSTAGDGISVAVDTSGPAPTGEQRCPVLSCPTPMRGGVRLHVRRDDGNWGSCTSGFNVRGSNGWVYVLTAGHCVTVPGPKRQYMYHNGLPVAWEKSTTNDSDPNSPADNRYWNNSPPRYDWALLPYQTDGVNWSHYWITNRPIHNRVNADCYGPSNRPCSSGSYDVTGLYTHGEIGVGWVVCATGSGTAVVYPEIGSGWVPGTRCGQIKRKNMIGYCYTCYGPGGYGLQVDICSRKGDSGGPLFSQVDRKAYGILSGGPSRSGPCNMSDQDEFGVYSPLSEILANATEQTDIAMSLITTASG